MDSFTRAAMAAQSLGQAMEVRTSSDICRQWWDTVSGAWQGAPGVRHSPSARARHRETRREGMPFLSCPRAQFIGQQGKHSLRLHPMASLGARGAVALAAYRKAHEERGGAVVAKTYRRTTPVGWQFSRRGAQEPHKLDSALHSQYCKSSRPRLGCSVGRAALVGFPCLSESEPEPRATAHKPSRTHRARTTPCRWERRFVRRPQATPTAPSFLERASPAASTTCRPAHFCARPAHRTHASPHGLSVPHAERVACLLLSHCGPEFTQEAAAAFTDASASEYEEGWAISPDQAAMGAADQLMTDLPSSEHDTGAGTDAPAVSTEAETSDGHEQEPMHVRPSTPAPAPEEAACPGTPPCDPVLMETQADDVGAANDDEMEECDEAAAPATADSDSGGLKQMNEDPMPESMIADSMAADDASPVAEQDGSYHPTQSREEPESSYNPSQDFSEDSINQASEESLSKEAVPKGRKLVVPRRVSFVAPTSSKPTSAKTFTKPNAAKSASAKPYGKSAAPAIAATQQPTTHTKPRWQETGQSADADDDIAPMEVEDFNSMRPTADPSAVATPAREPKSKSKSEGKKTPRSQRPRSQRPRSQRPRPRSRRPRSPRR